MPLIHELADGASTLSFALRGQLDEVSLIIERQLSSDLPAINRLCRHIERYRGKMLRPTLVLLSGLASMGDDGRGDSIGERHRVVGAVVELIHMATLVHDDVLDDARERRRSVTINALHGNEMAVMLGDYLISNAFHLCSSLNDPSINLALGEVTNTLCEGELLQLHHRNELGIDEATYYEIVRRKTASLIAEACRLGARLSGASETIVQALYRAGMHLGVAFQVQDDVLDLVGDPVVVGKSLGLDLEKGKMTLPVILHLASVDAVARGRALELIEARDGGGLSRVVLESGAVRLARERAEDDVTRGRELLRTLPEGSARMLLDGLARQIVERRL